MSSEVCPFCGKTYKRLKSHLPHCKAAASSKTPPTKQDVPVFQTASSTQLDAAAEPTELLSATANLKSKKSKKTPAATQSSPPSSASPPPSVRKKKKLSEQIKTASMLSSTSKPKKQSLRALIEAAKSQQVPTASLQGTRPAPEERLSSSTSADPLTSRTTAETRTNPDKDSVKDDAHPAFLSTDTKPRAASRTKVKKSIPTAKDASNTLHPEGNKSRASPCVRDDFWVDNEGGAEDLKMKSVHGLQARITLQDVKATLGRAKDSRQNSRPSILSQIQTDGNISPVPLPARKQDTALQPVFRNSLKSRQASLIPLQQSERASPAAPLLSGPPASQLGKAVSMNEGLRGTGLLTISPSLIKFSSPASRADGGLKSQLEIGKQNTADDKAAGALTRRSLGQVRLRELPEWLACRTPSHPKHVVEMVQRGWQWYYKRYIDVRKGGVGGLGMLLAGYCVLSYIWSYPHIKRDRWRKYH